MKVRFLGTGAASGWPNPYCSCTSCSDERTAGRARSSTSVLIDDRILLDCGPAALDGARALHQSLADVEHVVITHGHPDHLAPAFLLFRHWAHARSGDTMPPLHVWAPPLALASCEPWIAPDDLGNRVHLHPLQPGHEYSLVAGNAVFSLRTLPATHEVAPHVENRADNEDRDRGESGDALASEAVLLDLQDAHGVRLLYATDTGPLSPAALAMTQDRAYHLACIEETFGTFTEHQTGHLDLGTFPTAVEELRRTGAITDHTDVVAVHLGHHNPPTPVLRQLLAPMGVSMVDDGTTLTITASGSVHEHVHNVNTGATHLVLGGARSGKSRFAEALALPHESVLYVACARHDPADGEWTQRIAAHRDRRPSHWRTEETTQLAAVIKAHQSDTGCILIDCLGTWVTALIDDASAWQDRQSATGIVNTACDELIHALHETSTTIIMVSNEVGSGVVPASPSGRLFRDLLGIVNLRLAEVCTQVTLMVAGRALALPKSTPPTSTTSSLLGMAR